MNSTLSPDQISSYRRDGFVIQRDFLDAGELATWRRVLDAAVTRRGHRKTIHDSSDAATAAKDDSYYSQVFVQRLNLWQDSPEMKALILHPEIGRMCCELEGIDGIRVWHDQTLIKKPWANPTSFHLDNPYWSFHSAHAISIWVALDDATLQNGCLFFIPGSQREATYENVGIGPHFGALFGVYPQWAEREPVVAQMRAGDCSFHNGLCAHGAGANATPRVRRAMTCAFMPVGATYNGKRNILTEEQAARYQIGDEIDDDAQNPIVWQKAAVQA